MHRATLSEATIIRTLIAAITILHLGPGLAFALLAFGCDTEAPLLGSACGRGFIGSFGAITGLTWLVLAVGYAAWRRRARPSPPDQPHRDKP